MTCSPRSAGGLRACVVCGVVNMRRACLLPLLAMPVRTCLHRMRCQHEAGIIRSGAARAPSVTRDGWGARCCI